MDRKLTSKSTASVKLSLAQEGFRRYKAVGGTRGADAHRVRLK